jgi:hypothetical protein
MHTGFWIPSYKYKASAPVVAMAAVGARPVLYHHPAGDDALSMSSYLSHGGSSTSSFSAALAPAPPPLGAADSTAQFDISEFFDDVAQGGFAAPPAAPPHVVPADSGAAAAAASAANARWVSWLTEVACVTWPLVL